MWKMLPAAVGMWCVTAAQPQTGTVPAPKTNKLVVACKGRLKVQGETRKDILYVLTPRRDPATLASKSLDSHTIKLWITLPADDEWAAADLDLKIPRAIAAVLLESSGGDVEAYDLDGDLTTKAFGGRITLDHIGKNAYVKSGGGEIRVGHVGGGLKCFSAAGSIHVESAGDAYFETHGGQIFVREARGPVIAKTAGGHIFIQSAAATVDADTGGGVIDIARSGGPVVAKSGSGSIQISSAPGVKCSTGNGQIRLKGVSGVLDAMTQAGAILVELPERSPLENSFLKTGFGDVVVLVPSNLAVTVQAMNHLAGRGARIISEFPEIRINPSVIAGERVVQADGSIHGGGPVLKIEATGGTIYLRKQK